LYCLVMGLKTGSVMIPGKRVKWIKRSEQPRLYWYCIATWVVAVFIAVILNVK